MHFPVYIHLGPLTIAPHQPLEVLGCFLGFRLYLALRRRTGDVLPAERRLVVAFVKLSGNDENVWLFIPEGLLGIVVGLIAALVVTFKLPLESRAPFWIAGIACMFASFLVWGVTCAVGM